MKKGLILSGIGVCVLIAGCGPRLAEVEMRQDEKEWAEYIQKSYPGWKAPQRIPPVEAITPGPAEGELQTLPPDAAEAPAPAMEDPAAPAEAVSAVPAQPPAEAPAPAETAAAPAAVALETPAADATAPETAAPAASQNQEYVVAKGDTLTGIAKKFYHDAGAYKKIQQANKLENPDRIAPGMKLIIPMP